MSCSARKSLILALFAAVLSICATEPALAVIWHPDGEPNLTTWTDRPDPNVLGRWTSSASCVAVASNCVITTRHQGSGTGTSVHIAGRTYTAAEIWNYPSADLRVVKLYGANLTSFVPLYTNTDECSKPLVIGGYGDGRGALLQTGGITYGYEWDNSTNTTRRLGTNKVKDTEDDSYLEGYTSDIIFADFDGLNDAGSTDYECIPADHDSGGGWFIKDGNTWKIAGLSRGVGIHFEPGHEGDSDYILFEAWFRNRDDPLVRQPEYMDAVRISSYAAWLAQTIPPRLPADLTGDDYVNCEDFAVFAKYWQNHQCNSPDFCAGADSEPDGDVDWLDLAAFADGWLCDWDCYD